MGFSVDVCNQVSGRSEELHCVLDFTFKKNESCTAGVHIFLTSEKFSQFTFSHGIDNDESIIGQASAFRKRIYMNFISYFKCCTFPERNNPHFIDNFSTVCGSA